MTVIEDLKNFIKRAEKNRKYAPNTASGLRVGLSYFEKELNEDEAASLDNFKSHFDEIYVTVARNNQDKLSASSLDAYKRRVKGLLDDYEKYATDTAKFLNWNPVRKTIIHTGSKAKKLKQNINEELQTEWLKEQGALNRFELILRPDAKAVFLTPPNLTSQDIKKIKGYIDYLSLSASDKVVEES